MDAFEGLFPEFVAVANIVADAPYRKLDIFESQALGPVCEKRLRDFSRGRDCAHKALSAIRIDYAPLTISTSGAPAWPPDVVGSISHCEAYAFAAVARTSQCAALGIDVERHRALSHRAVELFATHRELEWVRRDVDRRLFWDAILFSVKEAVFKAASTLWGVRLAFKSIEVIFHPTASTFKGHIFEIEGRPVFDGRYAIANGLIGTAIAIRPGDHPYR